MKYQLSIELAQRDRRGATGGGRTVQAHSADSKTATVEPIDDLLRECEDEYRKRAARARQDYPAFT